MEYVRNLITKDGMAFRLRPATPADTDVITTNIRAVCAEQIYLHSDDFVLTDDWRQVLGHSVDVENGRLLIVAEVGSGVVGYLRLFAGWYGTRGRHVGEIGLSILQPWRERTIGTALMDYALDWAQLARFEKLTAAAIATNQRALHLFQKFEFEQEGYRPRQLRVGQEYLDEILLGRLLKD